MGFHTERLKKFAAGRLAHPDSPWDATHVDARAELMDEVLDAWNYADLLDDEVLKVRIQSWCQTIWQELSDMGASPARP
jgi:hypothetical protein